MRNPFTPNFGQVPIHMAGRTQIVDEMREAFDNGLGDPNLCTLFKGARGTGKTALLSYLARAAEQQGWISASSTALPGMLEDIYEQMVRKAADLIDMRESPRMKALSLGQMIGIEWEHPDAPSLNWRSRMTLVLDALAEQNIGLVITVDEVDPTLDEIVQLAVVYQHFVGEDRNVSLLMAGLPHQISSLLSGKSTSFLRRANQIALGRIAEADVADAFEQTVLLGEKTIEQAALDEAVGAIGGFPFMMQLVGYRSWKASEGNPSIGIDEVRRGVALAQSDMRSRVLCATLDELSNRDLDFLAAMLKDDEVSTTEKVGERLAMTSGNVSTYRRRLLEQGVIDEAHRGGMRFALPFLREYLPDYLEGHGR